MPCPETEFWKICTGDMKSVDEWYSFLMRERIDGESVEQTEDRLRRKA
jgi:hypothetical protein